MNYIFYNDVYYEDEERYNAFARLMFNSGVDYSSIKQSATIILSEIDAGYANEAIKNLM